MKKTTTGLVIAGGVLATGFAVNGFLEVATVVSFIVAPFAPFIALFFSYDHFGSTVTFIHFIGYALAVYGTIVFVMDNQNYTKGKKSYLNKFFNKNPLVNNILIATSYTLVLLLCWTLITLEWPSSGYDGNQRYAEGEIVQLGRGTLPLKIYILILPGFFVPVVLGVFSFLSRVISDVDIWVIEKSE